MSKEEIPLKKKEEELLRALNQFLGHLEDARTEYHSDKNSLKVITDLEQKLGKKDIGNLLETAKTKCDTSKKRLGYIEEGLDAITLRILNVLEKLTK